ncbi:MAG TPA: hypothetical protein G4O16_08300 [Dehalococcoidia bacterium]|nr:hypothetical protein [Dehalococcoidia bacterium]
MSDILTYQIEKQEVLHRIGYRDAENISIHIDTLVDDYLDNYHDFIMPSFSRIYQDIGEVTTDKVRIDSVTFQSSVLTRMLQRCQRIAVFVLTIGDYLEELVAYLATQEMVLQATVLDAVGSGAVEKFAKDIEAEIRREAAEEGRVVSRRFSPGYCDWDITQQKILFHLLDGNTAGVTLTENMLMTPRKSVSGIVGIGLPGRDIEEYNPCLTCRKKDCPGRRR